MEYTARIGDKPTEAHINYECPCGCSAGLIYDREAGPTELGQCCCGRLLWVGDKAQDVISFFYEAGVEYNLDVGSVTLPWGETAKTVLAVPAVDLEAETNAEGLSLGERVAREMAEMVTDVICGMPVRPSEAAAMSQFNGETYYFCSAVCKARFDAAPHIYAAGGGR